MAFARILLVRLRVLVLVLAYLNLVALAVNRILYIRNASNKIYIHLSWQDWTEIGCSLILAVTSLYGVIGPTTTWSWRLRYLRALFMFGMAVLLLCISALRLHDQLETSRQPGYQQQFGTTNPFFCDPVNGNRGQCYSYWINLFLSLFLGILLVPEVFLSLVCAGELPAFKIMDDVEMARSLSRVGPSSSPDPSPVHEYHVQHVSHARHASHARHVSHEPDLRVMYGRHSVVSSEDSPT